mgnify:CR=1 FL=1
MQAGNIQEKEELIEMLSIHFQNSHNLSPLGAKIWAVLIMDRNEDGLTFEYLVERLGASKSTISTNLNELLQKEIIYFETREGDRKKYFKAAPFSQRFTRILKNMAFEKQLVEKMIDYKSKNTSQCAMEQCAMENLKAFKTHLIEMERLTQKIIADLQIIEKKNILKLKAKPNYYEQ